MEKRLYRFMSAENALKTIEQNRLRVGRLNELNDPFEFIPALKGVPENAPQNLVTDAQEFIVNEFSEEFGILCFSDEQAIKDPVI
jgi:hypothetical protein